MVVLGAAPVPRGSRTDPAGPRRFPTRIYTGLGRAWSASTAERRVRNEAAAADRRRDQGGTSTEHDVSLASGDSIAGAVRHPGMTWWTSSSTGMARGGRRHGGLPAVIGCSRGSMSPSRPCTAVGVRTARSRGSRLHRCPLRWQWVLSSATCLDKARTKLAPPPLDRSVAEGRRPPDRTEWRPRPDDCPRQASAGRLFVKPPGRVEHRGRSRGSRRSWRIALRQPSSPTTPRWSRPRWSAARSTSRYRTTRRSPWSAAPGDPPDPARPSPSEPVWRSRDAVRVPALLDDATTRALESAAVTAFAAQSALAVARRHLRHPGWDRHQRGQHHAGSPPTPQFPQMGGRRYGVPGFSLRRLLRALTGGESPPVTRADHRRVALGPRSATDGPAAGTADLVPPATPDHRDSGP